jgi:hypothetical protein
MSSIGAIVNTAAGASSVGELMPSSAVLHVGNRHIVTAATRPKKPLLERPVSAPLIFSFGPGMGSVAATRPALRRIRKFGRTDSKRALGFVVTSGNKKVDFVLDRDQVAELAAFLRLALPGLRKPPGRKPPQVSLVALEAKCTPILDKGRETISAVDQPVRRGRPRRGEEGNALMQARPWKSAGVSRATWHRRRASTPR